MLEGASNDPPKPAEGDKPADGEKAADAKPGDAPAAAKPADGGGVSGEQPKPGEQPAAAAPPEMPAAADYKFTLPENITIPEAQLAPAIEEFRALGIKPDAAQKLIDRYVGEMQGYAAHMASEQQRIFAETRKGWRDEIMADPIIGGNGHQTAMQAVARMRDMFVSETDRSAFNEFLRVTGAGDHPQFIKMLHNAARWFDEPLPPPRVGDPPPNNGKPPGRRSLREIYRDDAKRAQS